MTLEVRQLVLRAQVRDREDDKDEFDQDELDDDNDDEDEDGGARPGGSRRRRRTRARGAGGCAGGADDPCEDKAALKEEILAACQAWLRDQLRHLNER